MVKCIMTSNLRNPLSINTKNWQMNGRSLKISELKRAANGKSFFDNFAFLSTFEEEPLDDTNARPDGPFTVLSLFCCQIAKLKTVKMSNFKSPGTFKNKKDEKEWKRNPPRVKSISVYREAISISNVVQAT